MNAVRTRRRLTGALAVLCLTLFAACQAQSGIGPAVPTATAAEANADSPRKEVITKENITFGPGPFNLADPKIGLTGLSSYQATLTMIFEGTENGQPHKSSKKYLMVATNDPPARQWTIDGNSDAPSLDQTFLAELSGMDYERRGKESCTATEIRPGGTLSERLELASFLSPLIGAEEADSETVNGVEAKHYTFDQRALGEQVLTESTGEVWVASEGGYVIKYLLTQRGKADYFGDGLAGTLTLDYELTAPNQPVTLQLPEDCPPGLVDAPLLADAAHVEKSPGLLSYETASSLKDAVDFYEKNLPGLGWQAEMESLISGDSAALSYRQGVQNLSIFMALKDGRVTVEIALGPASN